jgi:Tfp pilus assembly protein PilX
MIRNLSTGDSRGVALVAALFVLLIMSILAVGLLLNVEENLKITKNAENSEAALKVAEADRKSVV